MNEELLLVGLLRIGQGRANVLHLHHSYTSLLAPSLSRCIIPTMVNDNSFNPLLEAELVCPICGHVANVDIPPDY